MSVRSDDSRIRECDKKFEEKWTFLTVETNYTHISLLDFGELPGLTSSLPASPMSSDFYNNMSDSLFGYITECTNLRAYRHLANVIKRKDEFWYNAMPHKINFKT